jgi:hypothetical protein
MTITTATAKSFSSTPANSAARGKQPPAKNKAPASLPFLGQVPQNVWCTT